MKPSGIHPSPSKIVMTAILDLNQDGGTTVKDIVKYAKAKYGLPESSLAKRIPAALKRGVRFNILHREGGAYHLNTAVCKVPAASAEEEEEEAAAAAGGSDDLPDVQEHAGTRSRGKRSREVFLCRECREWVRRNEAAGGEEGRRYELRPRKAPSRGSGKAEGVEAEKTKPKPQEEKNYRRMSWKEFLKMRIPLQGRRRSRDKK